MKRLINSGSQDGSIPISANGKPSEKLVDFHWFASGELDIQQAYETPVNSNVQEFL
jgi:hypothetical protein